MSGNVANAGKSFKKIYFIFRLALEVWKKVVSLQCLFHKFGEVVIRFDFQ